MLDFQKVNELKYNSQTFWQRHLVKKHKERFTSRIHILNFSKKFNPKIIIKKHRQTDRQTDISLDREKLDLNDDNRCLPFDFNLQQKENEKDLLPPPPVLVLFPSCCSKLNSKEKLFKISRQRFTGKIY